MILKRVYFDENKHTVTHWTPYVTSAARFYDENWQADVVEMYFKGDHPAERVNLHEGEGVYLCNDEGKTIEVLSRLQETIR